MDWDFHLSGLSEKFAVRIFAYVYNSHHIDIMLPHCYRGTICIIFFEN